MKKELKKKYRFGHRKTKKLLNEDFKLDRHPNTVQAIMQKHHLQCRIEPKLKWKSQGEFVIIAPNLLQRNFTASAPNQKWVTDITYIQNGSSTMYLSTIMDLFNNEIVADHQQTPLVIDTFKEAPEMHGNSEDVIIHANQGNVYTSFAYQELVKKSHLISNMSRRRNCWDNAVIESFHSNIKSEEFQYVKFNSMHNIQVVEKVDEYMRYYNEDRILEKLGYLTPKEFGAQAA